MFKCIYDFNSPLRLSLKVMLLFFEFIYFRSISTSFWINTSRSSLPGKREGKQGARKARHHLRRGFHSGVNIVYLGLAPGPFIELL